VGNYDELSTARLTWIVLDRLVPDGDEADARAALLARHPELGSLVAQGSLSEDEALDVLRTRDVRYGRPGRVGPWSAAGRPTRRLAVVAGLALVLAAFGHLVH
jgi:hypothetical protein